MKQLPESLQGRIISCAARCSRRSGGGRSSSTATVCMYMYNVKYSERRVDYVRKYQSGLN